MAETIQPWGDIKQIDDNLKTYGQNIERFVKLFERISQRRTKLLTQIVQKLKEKKLTPEERQNYVILTVEKLGMLNNIYQQNIAGIRENLAALQEQILKPEFLQQLEQSGVPSETSPKDVQQAYVKSIGILINLFKEGGIVDSFMAALQEMMIEEKEAVLESTTPKEMKTRLTKIKKDFDGTLANATKEFRKMNAPAWDQAAKGEINFGKLGAGLLLGGIGINAVLALVGLPIQVGVIGGLIMAAGFWSVLYELTLKDMF